MLTRYLLGSALVFVGCSSPSEVPEPLPANRLGLACSDTEAAVFGDPGALTGEKGTILKCARSGTLTKEALESHARANGYRGKPFTSGAHVLKIAYRTERGDTAGTAGHSTAVVFVPDTPRVGAPLAVAAHGSIGQAAKCSAALRAPDGSNPDFENLTLPLVGAGIPVIAPDGAGYGNFGAPGNAPPLYAGAVDAGKSMLDATHAFRRLTPWLEFDKFVIVGHSLGGHTALSTLAMTDSYPAAAKLAGVATYAPLWLPQRSWGALLLVPSLFPIQKSAMPNAVSVWYHYTHSELLDGPGHGGDVFKPEKRALIKQFVDETCWASEYPLLSGMGETATDLFDPTFAKAIAGPAGAGAECPAEEPGKSLCSKWMKRYLDDRPHLTGTAAKIPILFLYGGRDGAIPAERVSCARDRLNADGAAVTYCVEPESDHSNIVGSRASYAIDWLLVRAMGGAEPPACEHHEVAPGATCDPIPPND